MLASKLIKLQRFQFDEQMLKTLKKRQKLRTWLENIDQEVKDQQDELYSLEKTIRELEGMARLLPSPA